METNLTTSLLKDNKQTIGVVLVLFCFNIIFKLFFLTDSGLWYDEVFSVFHSQSTLEDINKVAEWDAHPPFFYYLLSFWMDLFGLSEVAVRSLSLLFNGLGIVSVYLFAKRFFNLQTAIFAVVLFFCSDSFFYYAQEARTYSLMFFLYIISFWAFFNLLEKQRVVDCILLGVINYMIISTHYIEGIIVFFQGVIVLLSWRRKSILYFMLSGVLSACLLNFLIPRLLSIFLGGGNNIVSAPSLVDVTRVFNELLNNSNTLCMLFVILISVGTYSFFKHWTLLSDKKLKVLFLVLITFASHLILFLLSFKAPMYTTRYLLFTLPGFYILVAYLTSVIPINKIVKYGVFVLVGVVSLSTIQYKIIKPMNYKDAVPFIISQKTDKTLVVMQTKDLGPLFAYYYKIEVFKEFKRLSDALKAHDVFLVNTIDDLKQINWGGYDKVILAQTYQSFSDPNGEVKQYIESFSKKYLVNNDFTAINISAYTLQLSEGMKKEIKDKLVSNTLEQYMSSIKSNEEWLNQVKQKAKNSNIPLDSMLYLDALWMYNKSLEKSN